MNNYGWICSRCSKSNAPHVNSCDCSPIQQAIPYYPMQPYQPGLPTWPWYNGDYVIITVSAMPVGTTTLGISSVPIATTTLSQPQFDYTQAITYTDLCLESSQILYQNEF